MNAGNALIASLLLASSASIAKGSGPAWTAIGPEGGDVRSLAVDPSNPGRVYLGTAGGGLYRSDSFGARWQRLSPGFPRRDQNLDEIVVSPKGDLLIGFWDVHGRGGGVAVSSDSGLTFTISLDGESVRALRLSPSDPSQVIAGTLSGVFASSDGARHWRRISPAGHLELRNVESIAVDPRDPRVIYAGTWHLPWKTNDGGATWRPVHRGMIEDSDVFTMTLDHRNPQRVHATACSGIYNSANGAATWSRVRGIPFSSRRSRAFTQDVRRPRTFYAGTTEGLWVSEDDTATWRAATPRDVVVNAIVVLPDGSVLAGADGAGVLRSGDGGRSWRTANDGFSERFVSRVAFDAPAGRVLASVWGDRRHGGVFSAAAAGGAWGRLGEGLRGREVVSLAVAGPRALAGTDQGLFALGAEDSVWRRLTLTGDQRDPYPRVNEIGVLRDKVVVAGTSDGVYRSDDAAASWRKVLIGAGEITTLALSSQGALSLAATAGGLHESRDEGQTWTPMRVRPGGARVNAVIVVPVSGLALVATSRGVFRSLDAGRTWLPGGQGLPDSDFMSLATTPDGETFFVSDFVWGGVYRSDDGGVTWTRLDAGGLVTDRVWALALNPAAPAELLAASAVGGLHLRIFGPKRP